MSESFRKGGQNNAAHFFGECQERNKSGQALREQEALLNRSQEIAKIGSFVWNLKDDSLAWSKNMYALHGLREGSFAGSLAGMARQLIHPEDRERIMMEIDLMVQARQGWDLEFRIVRPDGEERIIQSSGEFELDDLGNPAKCFGMYQDITERKRAEEELANEATRRRILMEQSRDGIVIIDQEGQVIEANRKFADMLGYPLESMTQLKVFDWEFLYPPEGLMEMLNRVDETGDFFETRHRCRDGSTYDVEISTNGAWFAGQKLIFCICRDITTRRQASAKLQESNKRLESFLQISRRMTSSFDQDELMQVIVDNATEVMHLDSGALYLLADQETLHLAATAPVVPVNSSEKFRTASLNAHPHVREAITSGRYVIIADTEQAVLTPEEQEIIQLRNLRSNLYLPVRFRGHSIGVLILSSIDTIFTFTEESIALLQGFANQAAQIIDQVRNYEQAREHARELEQEIAERKQAEAEREQLQVQLLQSQKLESVGRLAGGVAHDFNNMLGVILGRVELALEDLQEQSNLYEDLKEIQTAAERSADLTRQLLAFARKQIITPRQLDLNDTVESMLNMLRRLIGEDIDLIWKPTDPLGPVKMDPTQINQILVNLCVNARDAIAGVGRLTIETGRQTFDAAYCREHTGFIPGDFVLLAVSDNGCGMDKKTLANLFEPFFTTKEVGQGTGLGLATVYGIVKQNNGFINVYSEPDLGSTFKIYLPRQAADDKTAMASPARKTAPGGDETILLVEDEPMILNMATVMLERLGYTVLGASVPSEAIRLAGAHPGHIDLLITDVVMPEMNGRDLAGKITSLFPGIKLLFMSGYTANVIGRQGMLDAGMAFIQKPFFKADLAEKVREVLGA